MPQVVTPPAMGMQEQASKNWYTAEALRKVKSDLINIVVNMEEDPVPARRNLEMAIGLIEDARLILNPPPKPEVKRVRPKESGHAV